MRTDRSLAKGVRVGVLAIIGVLLGVILGRASSAVWWQVLPWILLAGFWWFLLTRGRKLLDKR